MLLSLAAVAYRAEAVVVSQATAFSLNGYGYGSAAQSGGSTTWNFAKADANLGTLISANVTFDWTATVALFDSNPYSYPVNNSYGVSISEMLAGTNLATPNFSGIPFSSGAFVGQSTLTPGGYYNSSVALGGHYSWQFSSAADLSAFTQPNQLLAIVQFLTPTPFGDNTSTGSGAMGITYTYQAPDTGMTLGLFSVVLLGLGLGARLRRKG
ncbi:MAG: hypothetical protein ABIQ12_00875 [Opitutaceae bacterium]